MKKRIQSLTVVDISEVSVLAIRSKQSVRATFKLPPRSILLLSALSSQLGIKQKSLFDLLVDDREVLAEIAAKCGSFADDQERIAKTFVVSRKVLDNLKEISGAYDVARDALVQGAIERMTPLVAREKEKYQKRKLILEDLLHYQRLGVQLKAQADRQLAEDDPLLEKITLMINNVHKNCHDAKQFMARCCKIEEI